MGNNVRYCHGAPSAITKLYLVNEFVVEKLLFF